MKNRRATTKEIKNVEEKLIKMVKNICALHKGKTKSLAKYSSDVFRDIKKYGLSDVFCEINNTYTNW